MISVPVSLGGRSYQVHIGADLQPAIVPLIRQTLGDRRLAIITDTNVATLHLPSLLRTLSNAGIRCQEFVIPAGETSKSLTLVEQLCEQLVAARFDRSSAIIALGGGVIGDLAGFVAGIYFRGIPFIQMPTTVMAQVDSAVGGKTGVNTRQAKNLIGVFHQPALVLADVATLLTLPDRALFEGFAEVIKHGVIRDRDLFERLTTFRSQLPALRAGTESLDTLTAIIRRNVEIKAAIVAEDEFETKEIRALLNFGHTIGHAIEAVAGYGTLLHGEAISLGIVAAARLSVKKAGMSETDRDTIIAMLERFELPTKLASNIAQSAVMKALMSDKKFHEGAIRFVLSPGIGAAFVSREVTLQDIAAEVAALAG